MESKIFLPKKIKIGFNPRSDTYTGMLGYVIYHDGKVWRKQTSWESWRYKFMDSVEYEKTKAIKYSEELVNLKNRYPGNISYAKERLKRNVNDSYWQGQAKLSEKEYIDSNLPIYSKYTPRLGAVSSDKRIKPVEYNNVPLEGFVLNRKAGGGSSGWNHRATYCRVYDPRGFEFEITIPNLLYILENATSTKGKGLEGKFIYGWSGKDLVLIPEEAPEYKKMMEFTTVQDMKMKKKDLVIGNMYVTNQLEKITYLEDNYSYDYTGRVSITKMIWIYNHKDNRVTTISMPLIKKDLKEIDIDFAKHHAKLSANSNYSPKVKLNASYVEYEEKELKNRIQQTSTGYSGKLTVFVENKTKGYGQFYIRYANSGHYDSAGNYEYGPRWILSKSAYRSSKTDKSFKTFTELFMEKTFYKEIITKITTK